MNNQDKNYPMLKLPPLRPNPSQEIRLFACCSSFPCFTIVIPRLIKQLNIITIETLMKLQLFSPIDLWMQVV